MKKQMLRLILPFTLCLTLFAGCGDAASSSSESGSLSAENTASGSGALGVQTARPVLTIDTSGQTEPEHPLTEAEVKEIFEPLWRESDRVYACLTNDCATFEYEEALAFTTADGTDYSLITDEAFQTLDDVWNYAYSAYTKEAAERLFSDRLDQSNDWPRFLELGGKLYYSRSGHGSIVRFYPETAKVLKQYESMIILSMDYRVGSEGELETSVFVMCNGEDGWRMANSTDEAMNGIATADGIAAAAFELS